MATKKTRYACNDCGHITTKWFGKCPSCNAWGTVEEELFVKNLKDISIKTITPTKLNDIKIKQEFRIKTKFKELDRVLGGGLTKAEVVLITGNPGIGKSTFLLQLSEEYAKNMKVFYISGEESIKQIKERAIRLKIKSDNLYIINETSLQQIEALILNEKAEIVVIDSIQTIFSEELNSLPGSVTQIKESALKLIELAKKNDISFYIVGHVTKDGKLAGPKLLEHMVDAVLQIEGDEDNYYRIIRSTKNRYGSTNEISIFDIKEDGIKEVKNPSEFFISERDEKNIGSIIVPSIEGSRTILFEVQTLLAIQNYGFPKRIIQGYDKNRVEILATILTKYMGIDINSRDIYLNIPGGIELKDRAADLGVAFSMISNIKNIEISQKIAAIGELGLRGEVRKVSLIKKRVKELEKLGFTGVYLPSSQKEEFKGEKLNIKLNYINNIKELVERIK